MDVNEATSSPATVNSSGSTNASFNDSSSAIETVPKVNNLNMDGVQETGTDSSSPVVSHNNGKISSVVGEEDNEEGFVSGEEEFKLAPEKLIDDNGDNSDAIPFGTFSELPMPNDVVNDDDVKNDNKDGVLEGGKTVGVRGDEGKVEEEDESVVTSELSGDSISNNISDDSKVSQIVKTEGKPEVPDVNLRGNGGGIEGGTFDGLRENKKGSEVSESVESSVKDVERREGGVVGSEPEIVEHIETEGGTTTPNNDAGEEKEEISVKDNGVKLTSE